MRRLHALAFALAAGVAAAGCSTSPCQSLGEKLCNCTGIAASTCTTQVENQLKHVDTSQAVLDRCQVLLDRCNAPSGVDFCEWLRTDTAQVTCGLVPDPSTVATTQ